MKSIYLFFIVLAMVFCQPSKAVEKTDKLKVLGIQLVDEQNNPIVLRGVSFGWHNWHSRFYNSKAVETLAKDWKCSVVRAAIGVGPKNSYLQNPQQAIACAEKIIDAAIENGIYVIVDFHSHRIYLEEAKSFFTHIAEKYRDSPNIIYEIFNEPLDTHSWEEVKSYSEELIKTIRRISTDNIILIGTPSWCQDLHLAADNPIQGWDNIMYSMHFYAGTHKEWLRNRCDEAMQKGIPIFVSECAGMEASGGGAIDHDEWKNYMEWMEQRNISWVCWSISDKDETCSMLYPSASSTGLWKDKALKEWGKTVKNALHKVSKERR